MCFFLVISCMFFITARVIHAHTPEEKAFYLQSRIVLQLNPGDRTAGNAVGIWNLEYNELDLADKAFKGVLSYHPGEFLALTGRALIQEQRGKIDDALMLSQSAINFPEGFASFILLVQGRLLFQKGKINDAEKTILRGLKGADNQHGHRVWLGRVREAQGQEALAEKQYRLAIEADPFWLEPYSRLSLIYTRQGRSSEARQVMKDMITLDNPSPYPNNDIQMLWRWVMANPPKKE